MQVAFSVVSALPADFPTFLLFPDNFPASETNKIKSHFHNDIYSSKRETNCRNVSSRKTRLGKTVLKSCQQDSHTLYAGLAGHLWRPGASTWPNIPWEGHLPQVMSSVWLRQLADPTGWQGTNRPQSAPNQLGNSLVNVPTRYLGFTKPYTRVKHLHTCKPFTPTRERTSSSACSAEGKTIS